MSKTTLLDALNDSLDRLHAGQHVLDCLTAHPEHANELRLLLEAHDYVRAALPDQREVAAAQARGRAKVLAALRANTDAPVQHSLPESRAPLRMPAARLLSMAAALVLLFGVVTLMLAQNALPGDSLYSIKRFSERVMLSFDENGTLRERFAKRRIGEIESLLAAGRAETVSFSGQVEAQVDTRWVVAGLVLEVPPGTPGSDGVSIADAINVRAATTPDRTLLALSIELDNDEEDSGELLLPTPLPTMSSTPSPQPATLSPTPSPTATETPSVSPTATITQTQPATAVQTCVAQLPDGWVTYHVRAGDTLSTLAVATGTTPDRLASMNCLEDSRLIISGQLLFVPRLPDTAVPTLVPQITSPPPPPPPEPVGPVPPGPGDDDDDDDDDDDNDDDDDDDDVDDGDDDDD